jgi:RHS repeat-associated protein
MSVESYLRKVEKGYGGSVLQDLLLELQEELTFSKKLVLNEHHLYGSSRLGVKEPRRVLLQKEYTIAGFEENGEIIIDACPQHSWREVIDSFVYMPNNSYFYRMLAQKQYELSNHLGNVLATVLDRRIAVFDQSTGNLTHYQSDIITATALYPFGSIMVSVSKGEYRYGFNGMEKDNEMKGEGNSLDFGARIYDSRLGRWLSVDPLARKYVELTPFHFTGNNPILFVDFDGEDFGVKINNSDKTIVIVANVYTTNAKAYRQAKNSADTWNNKVSISGSYTVTFQMKVNMPATVSESEVVRTFSTVNFYRKNGKLKKNLYTQYQSALIKNKALEAAEKDPIGNSYAGNDGLNSILVTGYEFTAGQCMNGRHADMNTHDEKGDMGEYESLVNHEFGHFFGLDDKGLKYYPGDGGIMQYTWPMKSISDGDVNTILNYVKDSLGAKVTSPSDSQVTVLENIGKSDGSNPIGIKNEVEDD